MRDQSGWTLIELMLAMGLMLAIAATSLVAIGTGRDSTRSTASKSEALAEGRTALTQMASDARQATQVGIPSGGRALYLVTFDRPAGTTSALVATHVRYDCTAASSTRCDRIICSGAVPANVLTASCTPSSTRTVATTLVSTGAVFTPELNGAGGSAPSGVSVSSAGTITTLAGAGLDFLAIDLQLRTNDPDSATTGRTGVAAHINPVRLQTGVNLESFDN